MNNGGYKIIDFNSVDRNNGVSMVYEGIYNDIESTRKAILVSGLVIDGNEFRDEIVKITYNGTNVYLIGENFVIEITDNDIVTCVDNSERIKIGLVNDDNTLNNVNTETFRIICYSGAICNISMEIDTTNAGEDVPVRVKYTCNKFIFTSKKYNDEIDGFGIIPVYGYPLTALKLAFDFTAKEAYLSQPI
jgi:hypothetical protein